MDFIFLFSVNNSGTTVMSRYLAQQTGGYLPPFGNYEGKMVPAVFFTMQNGATEPFHPYDWAFIRREWERLARRAGKDLFVEASPPNFLRADAIFEAFGPGTRAVFSAASPYSFIASVLYNYQSAPLTKEKVRWAARRWERRASHLRDTIRRYPDIPRISYKGFCADPTALNRALGIAVKDVGEITGKANENTPGIVDQTRRQLAFLTAEEWDAANEVLAKRAGLVGFFGYEVTPGAELIAEARRDPGQYEAGLKRRASWGPRWRRMGLRESLHRFAIRLRAALIWPIRHPRRMR